MCRVQLQLLSFSGLWSFGYVFMLFSKFCLIYILVYSISHAEFSQHDVSATKINVPRF